MRVYFHLPNTIGAKLIEDTKLPLRSRDELLGIMAGLKLIFTTEKYQERVFSAVSHLNTKLGQHPNGRTGMSLWEIVCLSVVRHSLNTNYDRLHWMANYDGLFRQIMGVSYYEGFKEEKTYSLTALKENMSLLDEATIVALNDVVLEICGDVLKKKTQKTLSLKPTLL
jgi:transposase, IS5 family